MSSLTRIAVATAVALGVVVGADVAVAASGHMSREAVSELRTQVDAGQVKAATIYNHARVIHASLAGGRRYSVRYAAAERHTLVSALLAHHVRFHVLAGASTSHGLRRRYVVLIVLAALAAVAAAAYGAVQWRRRGRAAPG
jgi:hypothetical protein